ncbi:MAG TPA: TonB-dependent receptor [Chitinophagaceae bacterium]|jgi:hypothetical protein|nr:TonB-dependent receptor [Chitinophagaceae bacterium]
MKITRLSLLSICILVGGKIFSQGIIEGFIKDNETKSPIYGATINVAGNLGDNTDAFGAFRFSGLPAGQYELIASHIGYRTEIIPVEVKDKLVSTINVNLHKGNLDLSEVRLNSKKTYGLNAIGQVDIMLRPVNTSQDVLRIVPGVFIAQHAGGGKAEQIFLRGFDIDHGTDIALTVDGMPVNMVSHAHGQGYADMHFLIPETIEKVSFEMGPYNAGKGNLATAGFVDFQTKEFLTNNMLKVEAGDFNTQRVFGQLKLFDKKKEKNRQQFYVASEYFRNDSYFESPQDFHRFNIIGKYNAWFGNQSQLSITASTFDSRWDASGQIPERAVASGLITRFGSIDNSEGGNTSRTNLNIRFAKQWKNNWKSTDQFYYSRYHFNLYSNFTFFLDDPVNGDEINQRESRNIFGYNTTATKTWMLGSRKAIAEFGAGFRHDDVNDIELSRAVKRQFLSYIQKGDVKETNLYAYVNQHIELGNRWSMDAGVRYDHFRFGYKDDLAGATGFARQSKGVVSPKLNFSFAPSANVKLFLNNGIGFHSNDTRVILANDAKDILPRVYGTDLGATIKPMKDLVLKTTFWHLYSEQEFVYVGDAGIVEPSGKTRRVGIDLSARYQLRKWLYADLDLNFTSARAIGEAKGEDYVPLAPAFTSIGGLTAKAGHFSGSLRYRFIDDRPANEDNSVRAKGYFIADAVMNYKWKKIEFFVSMENILNRKWNEAQFDTESRLQFEANPVSEIHFTPGTPRFIKGGVSFNF